MTEFTIHPAQTFLMHIQAYPDRPEALRHHTPQELRVMNPYTFHALLGAVSHGLSSYPKYLGDCQKVCRELEKSVVTMTEDRGPARPYAIAGQKFVGHLSSVVSGASRLFEEVNALGERDLDETSNVEKVVAAQSVLSQALALSVLIGDSFKGLSVPLAFNPDPAFLFCRFIDRLQTAAGADGALIFGGIETISPQGSIAKDSRDIKITDLPSILLSTQEQLLRYHNIMFLGEYWAKRNEIGEKRRIVDSSLKMDGINLRKAKGPWLLPSIENDPRLDKNIDELELSEDITSCLNRAGIKQIGGLVQRSENSLLSIGFQKNGVDFPEVKRALAQIGLCLKRNVGNWRPKSAA